MSGIGKSVHLLPRPAGGGKIPSSLLASNSAGGGSLAAFRAAQGGGKSLGKRASSLSAAIGHVGGKKGSVRSSKKRAQPGKKAVREIKTYQNSTELLIRKLPFQRCLKDVVASLNTNKYDLRIQAEAVYAAQEATEAYIVRLIEDGQLAACHRQRVTLHPDDMNFARRMRGEV